MTGLRRKFRQADGSADSILADPHTRLRIALQSLMPGDSAPEFTSALFEEFTHALARSTADQKYLDRELPAVVAAIAKGTPPEDPNISRPETQLLWAAALIYILRNHEKIRPGWDAQNANTPLLQSALWQSLTTAPYATEEMINHHFYLSEAMRNPKVKMRWGAPGSWFYFSPNENLINADFLMTLLGGFEHTRSILFHEIGHSQLTVKFLPSMDRIKEQIDALQDKMKARGGKLSSDDYVEMRLLAAEWKLRMQLIDKTENAVVNRYAANMGKILAQDYGYSLNHTATTLSGYGAAIMRNDAARKDGAAETPSSAEARLTTIMNAINMVFFKNNAYFPNTKAGWKRLGIDPDLIRRDRHHGANDNAPAENGEFSSDFLLFLELCGGKDGLEHLQPSPKDRLYGREYYNTLTDSFADRRNAIAERIWDEFIEPFMPELRNDIREQIQKQMEEAKKQQQQQQKQQKNNNQNQNDQSQDSPGQGAESESKGGQKSEGQSGEGQSGEGQSGESQEQGGQEQSGQGQSGSKGQKGKPGEPGDDSPESGDSSPAESRSGEDAGQEDSSSGKAGSLAEKLAQEGLNENSDVDVDDVGSMPDVESPSDAPGQGKKADANADHDKAGNDKAGADGKPGDSDEKSDKKNNDGDGAKSLEELTKDLERRKREMAEREKRKSQSQSGKAEGQSADGNGQGDSDAKGADGQSGAEMDDSDGNTASNQAGGGGKEVKIEELAARDWSDYAGLVDEIAPLINQVARMMEKIRERQIQKTKIRSRHLEQLPQDNEIGRLDRNAHRDLIIKQRTGQDIEDNDLKRFRRDDSVDLPITPDFVFMIDGSMSMNSPIDGKKATHMHVALLSAIVLYEAAKKIDANVYISLWGNATPLLLAKPGDEKAKIGENLARAIRGLNSGTDLAPSFREMIRSIVENKEKTEAYAGYTHFMVLSDGDINDRSKSEEVIDRLFQASKFVTLDFGIIKKKPGAQRAWYEPSASKTDMEKVAENVQAKLPHQKVGSIVDNDPEKLTLGIVGLLIEKLMTCNSFTAVPQARKQSAFRRTLMSFDVK